MPYEKLNFFTPAEKYADFEHAPEYFSSNGNKNETQLFHPCTLAPPLTA